MNEIKNKTNFEINQVINEPYKYGFKTKIEKEDFPIGLNEDIIFLISNPNYYQVVELDTKIDEKN